MKLVPIDYTQVNLFSKKVCNDSASFFKNNKTSYKKMIVEQGDHFWTYLAMSFKSYCLSNRILDLSGISTDMSFTNMIEEVLEVTDRMLMSHWEDGLTLCEDLITVFQYRSFIDEIQSQSVMRNPFYMRDSMDTFRRLFGKPMEDKTMHLIKVAKTLQYLLHLGGCLFEVLRLWLQAEECEQDVTLYWKPPPEKPFHVFGEDSITLTKLCNLLKYRYKWALQESTLLKDDAKDGHNVICLKDNCENIREESVEDDGNKSKTLSIEPEKEDGKDSKALQLRDPQSETSSFNLEECPGCHDHLECIRKRVIDQGFVLPKIFEIHYEPKFHVKIRHCSQCKEMMDESGDACGSPSHDRSGKEPITNFTKHKHKGLTRKAQKQIAKKERRIQRRERAGKESQYRLEDQGLQQFAKECGKVPGFIEELEKTQPKSLVGVPLPKPKLALPPPTNNNNNCTVVDLEEEKVTKSDTGGNKDSEEGENKVLMVDNKEADSEKELKKKDQPSKREPKKLSNGTCDENCELVPIRGPQRRDRPLKKNPRKLCNGICDENCEIIPIRESSYWIAQQKDNPTKSTVGVLDINGDLIPISDIKENSKKPKKNPRKLCNGICDENCHLVPKGDAAEWIARIEEGQVPHNEGTPREIRIRKLKAIEAGKSDDVAGRENRKEKVHQLRECSSCCKKELSPKTYKKCQQCRKDKIKQMRYYCSRECQVQDWKKRHCKEHVDWEVQANNNNKLSMEKRLEILDVTKCTLLNDVE